MSVIYHLNSYYRDRSTYKNPCDYTTLTEQISTWNKQTRETTGYVKNPNQRISADYFTLDLTFATMPYPRIELFCTETVNISSILANVITYSGTANSIANNDILMTSSPFLSAIGLKENTEYHVINVAANSFQLSLVQGGVAIVLSNASGLNFDMCVISPADYNNVMLNLANSKLLLTYPQIYLEYRNCKNSTGEFIRNIQNKISSTKFVLLIDKIQYDFYNRPVWIHYKSSTEQTYTYRLDQDVLIQYFTYDGAIIDFFEESDLSIPTDPLKQNQITLKITPYVMDASYVNHNVEPLVK